MSNHSTMAEPEQRLLKPREVAERLRISERKLWMMCEAKALPKSLKLGPRTIRWRDSDITQFIERSLSPATPEVQVGE